MKALAEADGGLYLPNPEPQGPVEYVFVAMEPSLRGSVAQQRARIEAGVRNFTTDWGPHFAARWFLGPSYYITDLAKGGMSVARAKVDRIRRYDRWYPLLLEELDLVAAPDAKFFAFGDQVYGYLKQHPFPYPLMPLLHYSSQAAAHRDEGIRGHEIEFQEFKSSVTPERVLSAAEETLAAAGAPQWQRKQALARLAETGLSESLLKLIFNYKLAFEGVR
jgi:hypothetical protein